MLRINAEVETTFGFKITTGTIVSYSHTSSLDGSLISTSLHFWNSIDDLNNNNSPMLPHMIKSMKKTDGGLYYSQINTDSSPEQFTSFMQIMDSLAAKVIADNSDFSIDDIELIGYPVHTRSSDL